MHEWTMAHPYLTFSLAFTSLLAINNIIMGLIKSDDNRIEDSKFGLDVKSAKKPVITNDDDKATDTEYN